MKEGTSYLKIIPSSGILYPAAEFIRNKVMKYDLEYGNIYKVIVIDCTRVNNIDFTGGKVSYVKFHSLLIVFVAFLIF